MVVMSMPFDAHGAETAFERLLDSRVGCLCVAHGRLLMVLGDGQDEPANLVAVLTTAVETLGFEVGS